jgi:hypothetical protein
MERNNTLLLHELEGLVPVLSRLGVRVAELGESRILTAILTLETTLLKDLPELWTTETKSRTIATAGKGIDGNAKDWDAW